MDIKELTGLKEKIADAQKVLIGVGGEWKCGSGGDVPDKVRRAYQGLSVLLEGKDYYILTSQQNPAAESCGIPSDHLAAPARDGEGKSWEAYQKWLSMTLNRSLLILELGEGFLNPALMRWPFEKVCFLNQKACLVRVNEKFPQTAAELSGRSLAVKENSVDFILELCGMEENK